MQSGWDYFINLCQTIRIAIKVVSGVVGAIAAYFAFIFISGQIQAANPPAPLANAGPANMAPINSANPQFAPKPGLPNGPLDDNPRGTPPPKNLGAPSRPEIQTANGTQYGAGANPGGTPYGGGVYGAGTTGQNGTTPPTPPAPYGGGVTMPGNTAYGAGVSGGSTAPYGSGTANSANRQFGGPRK